MARSVGKKVGTSPNLGLFDGERECLEIVYKAPDLKVWENRVNGEPFAFDWETEGKDFPNVKPLGFSIATADAQCYVPVVDMRGELPGFNVRAVRAFAKKVARSKQLKIAHNAQFDLRVFSELGFDFSWPWGCTLILALHHNGGRSGLTLESTCDIYGEGPVQVYKEFCRERKMSTFSVHDIAHYSIPHARSTYNLWFKLKDLVCSTGQWQSFWEVDMPCLASAIWFSRNGIHINQEYINDLSDNLLRAGEKLKDEIHTELGAKIDLNSNKQLVDLLFTSKAKGGFGLRPVKYTDKENISVDSEVLNELVLQGFMTGPKILEFRTIDKFRSTFVDGIRDRAIGGRVYTELKMDTTKSGRFSSRNPNLQNIPKFDPYGIRNLFCASPGNSMCIADWSQIEMRLAAIFSGEPRLINAYRNGEDIHTETARVLFGKVTPESRKKGKTANFSLVYGMGAQTFATRLGSSVEDAQKIIDKFWAGFQQLQSWREFQINRSRVRGYTSSLCGRRRYLPNINSKENGIRFHEERVAANHPIQATAAEILKMAQTQIYEKYRGTDVRGVLSVHDEIGLECPADIVDDVREDLKSTMENLGGKVWFPIPLEVDINTGNTWLECH